MLIASAGCRQLAAAEIQVVGYMEILALTRDESVSCCPGDDQTKYLLETDEKRILLLIAFPLSTVAEVFKVVSGSH